MGGRYAAVWVSVLPPVLSLLRWLLGRVGLKLTEHIAGASHAHEGETDTD